MARAGSGCFDALEIAEVVELVQVKQEGSWRGIKIEGKLRPAGYPLDRGSYLQLGDRDVLLWTQGDASAIAAGHFYKEGKGIPRPLELVRFAGHGGWDEHCRSVLGLTKMNWNNDALYDRLPVTLGCAGPCAHGQADAAACLTPVPVSSLHVGGTSAAVTIS